MRSLMCSMKDIRSISSVLSGTPASVRQGEAVEVWIQEAGFTSCGKPLADKAQLPIIMIRAHPKSVV